MKISQQSSFVGFLVALATLSVSGVANAKQSVEPQAISPESANAGQIEVDPAVSQNPADSGTLSRLEASPERSIEQRMARLSEALQDRVDNLPTDEQSTVNRQIAQGWADGRRGSWLNGRDGGWGDGRGGSWLNGRDGGWADGRGGAFLNSNRWRNGWRDRGSFANWRDGWRRRR